MRDGKYFPTKLKTKNILINYIDKNKNNFRVFLIIILKLRSNGVLASVEKRIILDVHLYLYTVSKENIQFLRIVIANVNW